MTVPCTVRICQPFPPPECRVPDASPVPASRLPITYCRFFYYKTDIPIRIGWF